jgi:uncharacterized protein YndB with AHSA1/START domain
MTNNQQITVEVVVECGVAHAWQAFTDPQAVIHWNFASNDWHCPSAENDLKVGGIFSYRMEAKDGSTGFDFSGTYTEVSDLARIRYALGDDREVLVEFCAVGDQTRVIETFTPENTFPLEFQKAGWQAILDNYKHYAERGA